MKDKAKQTELTIVAIVSLVFGSVILGHMPHYFRSPNIDFSAWQPWVGGTLVSLGISLIVLYRLWERS